MQLIRYNLAMNQKVYEFKDYRKFIRQWAELTRGNVAVMAKAAQCQPSYISRAMHGEVQLNQDQAFALCQLWRMTEPERDYFMLLLDYDRAGTQELKTHLSEKLTKLREHYLEIKNQMERPAPPEAQTDIYFHSHWAILAVHALTDTRSTNKVETIAAKLGLAKILVQNILNDLEQRKLVIKNLDGTYIYNSAPTHLSKESPILPVFLQSWRQKAIMEYYIQKTENLHFTNVQTIAKNDFMKIRNMIAEVIKNSSKLASESNPEDLMVFNCDLFCL
jgi:uncharacterized protein (TIGR02147 family)